MPTIEIPEELAKNIAGKGEDLARFAVAAIRAKLRGDDALALPKTFGDLMAEGKDIFPRPIEGSLRRDGRAWSEMEGFDDAD